MGLISSVARMFNGEQPVKAKLIAYTSAPGEAVPDIEFQYFPDQIHDTKGAEYSSNSMPGSSHPIKQFISGSDRIISFTSIFTQDKNPKKGSLFEGNAEWSATADERHTVKIEEIIPQLRNYVLPLYDNGIMYPPCLCQLVLPGSGLVSSDKTKVKDSIIAVMTQCDITYDAFFRHGAMRIVTVAMSFTETIQVGNNWGYQSRDKLYSSLAFSYP